MSSVFYWAGYCAFALPFLTIAALLSYSFLRGVEWGPGHLRRCMKRGIGSSSAALGAILLFAQVFYRPSMVHAIEVRQVVEADDDDTGDPAPAIRRLERQLRQIRRGEPVEQLVLRL